MPRVGAAPSPARCERTGWPDIGCWLPRAAADPPAAVARLVGGDGSRVGTSGGGGDGSVGTGTVGAVDTPPSGAGGAGGSGGSGEIEGVGAGTGAVGSNGGGGSGGGEGRLVVCAAAEAASADGATIAATITARRFTPSQPGGSRLLNAPGGRMVAAGTER